MDPKTKPNPDMEGEGNKTADAEYRKGATEYAHSGKVAAGAKEAERALDDDGEELEEAVEAGREPSAGDLAEDLEKAPAKGK